MQNLITSDDILGTKVIDASGGIIGIVDKVYVDPETVSLTGISVDKGFLKKGFVIGKGYIRRITKHAVFLKIRPSQDVKGMAVFDMHGRKVGTVVSVATTGSRNKIDELTVSTGAMRKTFTIHRDQIETIKSNVILNVKKGDL